tara:strand:- start:210 stop:644 length:435 start_codon:yes stop_codon:yes gene_type:complete
MSRSAIMDRIDALLDGVSDPNFTEVMRGEPLGIAGTPCVAFWLTSRDVEFKTLTGVTSNCNFTIRAYFRMQTSKDIRETTELDVWDAMVNIDTALRADSDLSGNAIDTDIGTATTGYTEISGVAFRTVDIPYSVMLGNEVTITP